MGWQLWVVLATVAVGLLVLLVLRVQRAQRVFDDILDQFDDARSEVAGPSSSPEPVDRRIGDRRTGDRRKADRRAAAVELESESGAPAVNDDERARQLDEVARQRRRHTNHPTYVPSHERQRQRRTNPHRR
ncbi:hypothetical protein FB561_0703 [Kribbella amoyensis]|uniref:Uncharacterized protein n=1 Tax=Kribbella amoyensis TaxID=996641 RepID=A0A561BLB2_9ACTN|nr:hypothetical protein [Kribbella amoyensis]TWD79639.1 hypothetical protein FB561_0703 [Kribbella amoyensis]